jgi:hypothetical protein
VIIRGKNVSSARLAWGGAALAALAALAWSTMPASATPAPSKAAPTRPATAKAATARMADPAKAVKQAFTQAFIVTRQLGVPTSQGQLVLRPAPVGRTDPQAASRQGVPSIADRELRVARDRRNISGHFASVAMLARQNHNLDTTMTALADPNIRILGAGVSQLTFTSVTLRGNTATVVARAHDWTSSMVRQQPAGSWLDASPAADTVCTARLLIGPAGTWLVTSMIERFANGSGP